MHHIRDYWNSLSSSQALLIVFIFIACLLGSMVRIIWRGKTKRAKTFLPPTPAEEAYRYTSDEWELCGRSRDYARNEIGEEVQVLTATIQSHGRERHVAFQQGHDDYEKLLHIDLGTRLRLSYVQSLPKLSKLIVGNYLRVK